MQLRKRILGTLADVAIARPWTVCAVAALVALVSVVLIAVFGLQVESSRSALWPDDHPLQKRFRAFEGEFGSSFQLIVAIESDDPTKNKEVAERVAARIRDEVPVIESVLYKLDFAETLDRAPDLAPLYADVDDLREGARWVAKLAPAQPAKQDVKLGGLVGMLERANGELDGLEEGETKALSQLEDHIGDVFDGAGALFDEIDTWLDEPERREFRQVEETISGQAAEMLEKAGFGPQGYLADDSGRLLVLMCQPDEARDDLPYLLSFVEPIRAIAQEEQASNPGVTVGLTGMPVFSTEEMGVINTDLSFITVVSAVGVLLLFVLGYGSLWNTLFIALTLVLGVLVDLAFTASCVGGQRRPRRFELRSSIRARAC